MSVKSYFLSFSFFVLLFLVSPVMSADLPTGTAVPESRFLKIEGDYVSLDDLMTEGDDASPLILSFFNTACVNCPEEIKELQKLYEKYNDESVVIRIVNVEEKAEAVKEYIEKQGFKIPVLLDSNGIIAERFGVKKGSIVRVPQIFVIGKNKILKYHSGGYDPEIVSKLEKVLPEYVAEKYISASARKVNIIYTNSSNAWFESCDCPTHPYGGLVRRAYYIRKNRTSNTLLLDSGDNFTPYLEKLKNETVLKVLKYIKYDFLVMGDQEFALGKDYWAENFGKEPYGTMPYNTGNLYIKTKDGGEMRLGEDYVVKKVGLYNIAVTGVISSRVFMFYPKDKKEGIIIKESPKEFLTRVIARIKQERKDIHLIVVVSHSGEDEDRKLAEEVPGIDIIVGGHSQSRTDKRIKSAYLVQAGENAQCVGKLTVEFNPDGKIKNIENNLIQLTKDYKDDPETRELIDKFKEEYKEGLKSKVKF